MKFTRTYLVVDRMHKRMGEECQVSALCQARMNKMPRIREPLCSIVPGKLLADDMALEANALAS